MQIIEKLKKGEEVKIIAFGDSITEGCFELEDGAMHKCKDPENAYFCKFINLLKKEFKTEKINAINMGVGGDDASNSYAKRFQRILDEKPDLCTICFALNDVNKHIEVYKWALDSMFKELKKAGIETLFITPNMLNKYPCPESYSKELYDYSVKMAEIQNSGLMTEYINSARALAKQYEVPVCDNYKEYEKLEKEGIDTTALLANRINHPTREIHTQFAERMLETVKK